MTVRTLLGAGMALLLGAAASYGVWRLTRATPERESRSAHDGMPLANFPGVVPRAPGQPLPAILAGGWINGMPDDDVPGVLVVDVWADWCPVCRDAAPALVRLHEKHRNQGARFVSLTTAPRAKAEEFVRHFAISWPCGYDAPAETLISLGAVRPAPNPEVALAPGFGSIPTLFVVGRNGAIRWHDAAARYRHRPLDSLMEELDREIAAALAAR